MDLALSREVNQQGQRNQTIAGLDCCVLTVCGSSVCSVTASYASGREIDPHHYVNVSVLIKFSQKTSVFTLPVIIISSP